MLKTAKRKKIVIGPEDNGRRMSLDDFDHAIAREGYLYELGKGVIEVSEVPKLNHGRQVQEIRNQLVLYQAANPGTIDYLSAGSDAKLLIGRTESERHPDVLVYCNPPLEESDPWSSWEPEIVVEVISESSRKRDYEEKPDEYLDFGIKEYWIVDAAKNQMTVLERWRAQWRPMIVRPPKKHATKLLPGFALDLKRVFDAAKPGSRK